MHFLSLTAARLTTSLNSGAFPNSYCVTGDRIAPRRRDAETQEPVPNTNLLFLRALEQEAMHSIPSTSSASNEPSKRLHGCTHGIASRHEYHQRHVEDS